MQAVMLEKALYKVPHESGWFENESKHTELGSSDEEDYTIGGDDGEASKSAINEKKNDDDYQKAV